MTARSAIVPGLEVEGVGRAEKSRRERGQDTSRTPKSPKSLVFQRFGAGASVGARAARKEKTKDFNEDHGTIGLTGRKTVQP